MRELTYREAINEALRQEMERDSDVIIMGEDIAGAPGRDDPEMEDAWGGVLGVIAEPSPTPVLPPRLRGHIRQRRKTAPRSQLPSLVWRRNEKVVRCQPRI